MGQRVMQNRVHPDLHSSSWANVEGMAWPIMSSDDHVPKIKQVSPLP